MQAVPHENAGQRAEWDRLQEHKTPIHDISPKRDHRCGQRGVNVAVNAQTARLVQPNVRCENAKSRGHQQRDDQAAREPLEQPQAVDRLDVRAERISTLEVPHSAIATSVQRLNVKIISSRGEIAMPMISADTYRLSIQVRESWLTPSAPLTSVSAMDIT